tara:strand:- start:16 stop:462 length:447 start_codon:yes stop_codon:yes gene_type:complete
MKNKNILLTSLLIFTLLSGCGYKPIYSSKDFLFKISEIKHDNKKIDKRIVRSLKSISNENATSSLTFELNSKKEKNIISKNKNGDPEIFELKIMINIIVNDKQKTFLGKQVYNNTENKFELNEYEIQIEKQIITKMIDEIIIFLSEHR